LLQANLPNGTWSYDDQDPLGSPGGFGIVFRGRGTAGEAVAVKRLQSSYQSREMQIADFLLGHGLSHVIPILDAGFGQAVGTNFIIMPIATMNLQQFIDMTSSMSERESLEILEEIAIGLDEIGDIIHRDLKPPNILLHEKIWKLADLGLARFAEATTSIHTMREALTPAYAAPEQWRGERPQKATDIYAFGCIMYAVLQGAPPFFGPETTELSHQHQFLAPPRLKASPHVQRLASACLAKMPELRPPIADLRRQLQIAQKIAKGGRARQLAAVAAAVAERMSLEEQQKLQAKREALRRQELTSEALDILAGIFTEIETSVLRDAPNATVEKKRGEHWLINTYITAEMTSIRLGHATLRFGIPFPRLERGHLASSDDWDLLAAAYISVRTGGYPDRGRSADLWFGQLLKADIYRWWEVSYVDPASPDGNINTGPPPFGFEEFHVFTGHAYLVAEAPFPVTPELVDDFIDRWIDFFSVAASGDSEKIEKSFPKPFTRRPIPEKFALYKP
jgi:eukaryotic-like serine/threonine-protein kinase